MKAHTSNPISDFSFFHLLVLGMGLEKWITSALRTYTFLVKEARQVEKKSTSDRYKVI